MIPLFFPAIAMGISAAVGAFAKNKAANARSKNNVVDLQNQIKKQIWQQQQFSPFAPFATLGKGRMVAALARSWGFDKVLGEKYLNHIENAGNVPGTAAIGGAPDIEPPNFEKRKTGGIFDTIAGAAGVAGDIAGGAIGGGGGVPPTSNEFGVFRGTTGG